MNKFSLYNDVWRYIVVLCLCTTMAFAKRGKGKEARGKRDASFVSMTNEILKQVQSIQTIITGKVTADGIPLAGVTVTVKAPNQVGGDKSTITDENGTYSIAATTGDVLIFSFTGFKKVAVTVGSRINCYFLQLINILFQLNINGNATTNCDCDFFKSGKAEN